MKKLKGSNQHKDKYHILKTEVVRDLWMIVALTAIAIFVWYRWLMPKIISPCPDSGCGIHTVKAGDPENLKPREVVLVYGLRVFGLDEAKALDTLVFRESSYNPWAVNPNGGACGLFQAYPCKKMKCDLGDSVCQTEWGINYIQKRYKTPSKALEHHNRFGWY